MQTQSIAGTRTPDQAPPSRDKRPASMEFSAMLGSLFEAFPVGKAPDAAGICGTQDRPSAGSELQDATRIGDSQPSGPGDDNTVDTHSSVEGPKAPSPREKDSAGSNPSGQQPEARAAERKLEPDGSSAPRTGVAHQPGTSGQGTNDGGSSHVATPAVTPTPLATSVFLPATPEAGTSMPATPSSVAADLQDFVTVPEASGEVATVTGAQATAGLAPASPNSSSPVLTAGDSPVSAATPAEPQVNTVSASGPQAGAAAPTLRTAKPEGPLAPSSVDRVAAAVKAQASLGGGRVKMLLHPPHLGALRIEVAIRDGVVFARMETDSQAARHSLQQHSFELRQSLEEQGLSLGSMSVSVSQGESNGSEGAFSSNPAPLFPEAEPEIVSGSLPEARLPRLLDVTV
jgi:flagellar hook-length control protein FliK